METSEFKEKIKQLVRSAKTEEALEMLLERSKSLGSKQERSVSILIAEFKEVKRKQGLDLADPKEIQRTVNRIHDSILVFAEEMDKKAGGVPDALPASKKHRRLFIGGGFLIVSLSGIFWFVSQFASNSKCSEVKKSAEETLHRVVESKKNNSDTFDELKYIFLEEVLRNHIHLTSCDSTDAIIRDIETANKFLKKHGK
jgi:hypothetical protein